MKTHEQEAKRKNEKRKSKVAKPLTKGVRRPKKIPTEQGACTGAICLH
jgi:hypothetical protein